MLRSQIENRLLVQDPIASLAEVWPVEKVEAATEAILQKDRFDRNWMDSEDEKTMRQTVRKILMWNTSN